VAQGAAGVVADRQAEVAKRAYLKRVVVDLTSAPNAGLGGAREGAFIDDAFHHDRRRHPLYPRQGRKLLVPKPLIGVDVGGGDADEVVRVSEKPFCMTHLGDVRQTALEFRNRRRVFALHRHVHEDLEAEAERRGIDDASIPADYSRPFQLAQPTMAGGGAEPDAVGERGDTEPSLRLEFRNDLSVNGVHGEDHCRRRAFLAEICEKAPTTLT
jgi:hypothetical protein